jgi:predicted HD superfamily hydrolase involved in NAD metabolism
MRQQVLAWLQDNVPPSRVQHTLGVEQMSTDLAHRHDLDAEKAELAGLMHDLAKYFAPEKLLKMAKHKGIEIDPVLEANPHLLHADVSAIVAQEQFGVEDEEILSAIANHTLGRPQMSDLSCVIFVADALEPNRGDTSELNEMRETVYKNLHRGVQQTSDYSLRYLIEKRRLIHPRTIMTRNWALQVARSQSKTQLQSTST